MLLLFLIALSLFRCARLDSREEDDDVHTFIIRFCVFLCVVVLEV